MENEYIKTEFGPLPFNWRILKLSEMIEKNIITGHLDGNHGQLYPKREEFVSEGVPYISANCIRNGRIDFELSKYLTKKRADKFRKGVAIDRDVLFAHNATVGPVAHLRTVEECIILGTSLTYYRCNFEELVPEYLMYYMDSQMFRHQYERIMGQSTRNQVPITTQKMFKHIIPPLPEQKKIAKILSTVDGHIVDVEDMIDDLKELKKGLMQKLLTEGIGHTEFKNSTVGRVPAGWKIVKSREIIKYQSGNSFKSKDSTTSGVKWFKIANVGIEQSKWSEISYLPDDYLETYKKYRLYEGDLIMALTRPILRNKLKVCKLSSNDVPALLNQRVAKLEAVISDIHLDYYYQFIQTPYFVNAMNLSMAGTDPPNMSVNDLDSIMLPIPPYSEQKEIALILSKIDDRINGYKEMNAEMKVLKKGLMQQLLTGKTRVKIDN